MLLSVTLSGCFGVTVVVWISINRSWAKGFFISVLLAAKGLLTLAAGKPFYRNRVPGDSRVSLRNEKLVVSLRNEKLADAARDPNYAGTWVWEHVGKFFPATQIEAIAVGNEVFDKRLDLAQHLLITYTDVPNIDLDYFLGQPNYSGVRDPVNGRIYKRLLDPQIDATYTAMADLGFGVSDAPTATTVGASLQQRGVKRKITVRETGCPNCSGGRRWRNVQVTEAGGGMLNTSLAEKGCSLSNAQTYNRNLVERMLSGQTATPLFPDADMDV